MLPILCNCSRSHSSFLLDCRGLLLQENNRFSEALHYYKLAIGSRPTLACKYSSSFYEQFQAASVFTVSRQLQIKRSVCVCARTKSSIKEIMMIHRPTQSLCFHSCQGMIDVWLDFNRKKRIQANILLYYPAQCGCICLPLVQMKRMCYFWPF